MVAGKLTVYCELSVFIAKYVPAPYVPLLITSVCPIVMFATTFADEYVDVVQNAKYAVAHALP